MKRATLALVVAALTVTGAAGAAQASTHHASNARHGHSRIHSIHREDRIAVSAGATQPATTEPGDDRIAPIAGTTPVANEPGDDRGVLSAPALPAVREPGEDTSGHGGLDDGPNHS
ncbi:MAG: hypothetical protein QOI43_948 [Gaiellales bacterium]|nr:hypothetical protein [Gaiellales bacterium]